MSIVCFSEKTWAAGLVLEDLAGKETVRQSTMREVLKDNSGAINAAETWIFSEHFQLFFSVDV